MRPSSLHLLLFLLAGCAEKSPSAKNKVDPSDSSENQAESADSTERVPGEDTGLSGLIRINEVVTSNSGSLSDGDGDSSDWIELYNPGDSAVSLRDWGLSDQPDHPYRWRFGDLTLDPKSFVLVFASGKDTAGPADEIHTSFSLEASGVSLVLTDGDGGAVDRLDVPALQPDVSFGLEEPVVEQSLLTAGASARFLGDPSGDWTKAGFDDRSWHPVVLPVGFDGTVSGGTPAEVALYKSTHQSSDGYGFTGAQGVDGDPGTFTHTADGDLQPSWEVDLGANYRISHIQLVNRLDCCQERLYNVVVSVLGQDGTVVWSSDVLNPVMEGQIPTSPGGLLDLDLNAVGRWVQVQKTAVNGAGSSEWLSLADVAVTATPAAPYAGVYATDVREWMTGAQAGLRTELSLEADNPTRLVLSMQYDDGFQAFWDGVLVASGNVGAPVAHDGAAAESYAVTGMSSGAGSHIFAMAGDNLRADDDDFLMAPALQAQWFSPGDPAWFPVATPGAPNGEGYDGKLDPPSFDPPRGFFEDAQNITVRCLQPGTTLLSTGDGQEPTPTNATVTPAEADDQAAVRVVSIATTSLLRGRCTRPGWADSEVATNTYLYLQDVLAQPANPPGFPAIWSSRQEGDWAADYEMDPEITNDPTIREELLQGLREIPTLSIVMPTEDLFGDNGIYSNSADRGDLWERRASLELILPDGSTGFAQDAKLQIHGYGWRYHSATLKHSFRISFLSEYGASRLSYPWFVDAPVSRFDSIVLRAGGSKTWLDFRNPDQGQYLHDAFARDTARDLGEVDGHATYVHLYLNGLYWGLYMPVERPDAGFAAEYFGGQEEAYDAINRRTTTNEAIDGDLEAYNTMMALADADLSVDANVTALEQYLNLDNLIDWMLIHQYMSNHDGPCCAYGNNQRGTRRRAEGEQYRFYVWDMEYSLWDPSDTENVNIDVPGHASHIYTRLRQNAAFRARFAARAKELLTGNGALTPAASEARYKKRADEIYSALLGESARWGDTYRSEPYRRDVEWIAEYERLMNDYFPRRSEELIRQLQQAGLYEP